MADSLERRVVAAANAALDRNRFVAPVDVLTGLGWLRAEHAEAWRRGRVPYLERVTVASLGKLGKALHPAALGGAARAPATRDRLRLLDQRPPPAAFHQDRRREPGACLPHALDLTRTGGSQTTPNGRKIATPGAPVRVSHSG